MMIFLEFAHIHYFWLLFQKSAGTGKDSRKAKKFEEEENFKNSAARKPQPRLKPGGEEVFDETPAADEVDMLDTLTGMPMDEDELLFAVPVIAPYQTLHNYKWVNLFISIILDILKQPLIF